MSYGVYRPDPRSLYPRNRHPGLQGVLTQRDTWLWVSFPTPSSAPGPAEEFVVQVRRTATGATDPTARVELWENGVFRATALSDTAVTSTTSQILTAPWSAASLSDSDGSEVEAYIYGTTSADGARVEIGAVEWNATPQPIHLVGMIGIQGAA
jgi:hypothetical protein